MFFEITISLIHVLFITNTNRKNIFSVALSGLMGLFVAACGWCGSLQLLVAHCGSLWFSVTHYLLIASHFDSLRFIVTHYSSLLLVVAHCGLLWFILACDSLVTCDSLYFVVAHFGLLQFFVGHDSSLCLTVAPWTSLLFILARCSYFGSLYLLVSPRCDLLWFIACFFYNCIPCGNKWSRN